MSIEVVRADLLSPQDLSELAELHCQALSDSILTVLGTPIVQSYYKFLFNSASEKVFLARKEGKIIGACVVSFKPHSLMRRFASSMCVPITWAILKKFFFDRHLRDSMRGLLAHDAPDEIGSDPEVVQIFVDSSMRGAGIGQKLLDSVESLLSTQQVIKYYVKTESAPSNSALIFYRNNGFQQLPPLSDLNAKFVYLTKLVNQLP